MNYFMIYHQPKMVKAHSADLQKSFEEEFREKSLKNMIKRNFKSMSSLKTTTLPIEE